MKKKLNLNKYCAEGYNCQNSDLLIIVGSTHNGSLFFRTQSKTCCLQIEPDFRIHCFTSVLSGPALITPDEITHLSLSSPYVSQCIFWFLFIMIGNILIVTRYIPLIFTGLTIFIFLLLKYSCVLVILNLQIKDEPIRHIYTSDSRKYELHHRVHWFQKNHNQL